MLLVNLSTKPPVLTYTLAAYDMLVLELQAIEDCNSWHDTILLLSFIAVFWFLFRPNAAARTCLKLNSSAQSTMRPDTAVTQTTTTDYIMWLKRHP
jgi:cbb3-type cytochrome oxidase subunit 3